MIFSNYIGINGYSVCFLRNIRSIEWKNQSSLTTFLSVNTSLALIGETAATSYPVANYGFLNATPQDYPFLKNSSAPSTMSSPIPTISPACNAVPYLGPVELLLWRVYPLYIPQPFTVSVKAYYKLSGAGLHTPILNRCPLLMKISK